MTIKKGFEDIVALLEANKNKKVSTILEQVIELATAKGPAKSFVKNSDGEVKAIFCYYHKKWEDPAVAEYGTKTKTATGLNTMCKEGCSAWTKQLRVYKSKISTIQGQLIRNVITREEFEELADQALKERDRIEVRCDEHGEDKPPQS